MAYIEALYSFWANRRVLITGHTGFVGSWLTLTMIRLGAKVIGYSNDIPTEPSLFKACQLHKQIESITGDVRDFDTLYNSIKIYRPQVIFHLAAQPLVKESYNNPIQTYDTNILGTVNLCEAIRKLDRGIIVVNMTSDKCYENTPGSTGHKEEDRLGGRDPYSSSKACSELITTAYRESFFSTYLNNSETVSLCSVRAGNIIGGGDWAKYRLIPDCIRAFERGEKLLIRYPTAVRPWQHVLDVIYGFVVLVEKISEGKNQYCDAWNIGPDQEKLWNVEKVVEFIAQIWDGIPNWEIDQSEHVSEEIFLLLDNTKAKTKLGWRPVWQTQTALNESIDWYTEYRRCPENVVQMTYGQIERFFSSI